MSPANTEFQKSKNRANERQKRLERVQEIHREDRREAWEKEREQQERTSVVMAEITAHQILGQLLTYCERKLKKPDQSVNAPLLAHVERPALLEIYTMAEKVYFAIERKLEGVEVRVEFSSRSSVDLRLIFHIKPWGHVSRVSNQNFHKKKGS